MAQRTAVEDLIIALKKFMLIDGVDFDTINAAIELAENRLEMEKKQTIDAYKHGQNNGYNYRDNGTNYITAEEYYEQTYKAK
jgi:hypothetical protein